MQDIQKHLTEIANQFDKFNSMPFDDDLADEDFEKSTYYQAKWQIVHQIDLLIRELRKIDKTAYSNEIKTLVELWADNCGCWIDRDIEDDLLNKLIDDRFLSQDEIMIFNNNTHYRQG